MSLGMYGLAKCSVRFVLCCHRFCIIGIDRVFDDFLVCNGQVAFYSARSLAFWLRPSLGMEYSSSIRHSTASYASLSVSLIVQHRQTAKSFSSSAPGQIPTALSDLLLVQRWPPPHRVTVNLCGLTKDRSAQTKYGAGYSGLMLSISPPR